MDVREEWGRLEDLGALLGCLVCRGGQDCDLNGGERYIPLQMSMNFWIGLSGAKVTSDCRTECQLEQSTYIEVTGPYIDQ